MRQDIVFCNVAVYLSRDVARRAVKLSNNFSKGVLFTLDSKHSPHITIYMAAFKRGNLPSVKKILTEIVSIFVSPKFNAAKCVRDWNDYVGIYFTKTKDLSDLQTQIVKTLNPLRERVAHPYNIKFTKAEKNNIKKYGYDLVFKQFKPHLTITRFKSNSSAIIPRISAKNFSFRAHNLVLFEMGEHATSRKVLGKFHFGGE